MERREHQQTARTLRQVEVKLRRVFESPMIGMAFWRKDGSVLESQRRILAPDGIYRRRFAREIHLRSSSYS